MSTRLLFGSIATCASLLCFATGASALTPMERLGKHLFEDTNLSNPPGQSCKTCHHPSAGFADPLNRRDPVNWPVSLGADGISVGDRNDPTAAYAAFSPTFGWDEATQMYVGGQFWDGRAATLADQAKGPFLNPVEMANTVEGVVGAVLSGTYSQLFRQVCGPCDLGVPEDVTAAYDCIADAIAAYEATPILLKFTSTFDAFLAGTAELSPEEALGMELFNGNCATCHPTAGVEGNPPLFTDFTYDNLGIPLNQQVVNLRLAAGLPYTTDLGLGGRPDINDPTQYGKFKVPTLRNVAKTPPYGHNGYFANLYAVVDFYNTRDVASAGWPDPEVPETVNMVVGNLGLSVEEVDAIVAFLLTLSDGVVVHTP